MCAASPPVVDASYATSNTAVLAYEASINLYADTAVLNAATGRLLCIWQTQADVSNTSLEDA